VRTKRGADRLVKRLGTRGVKALALHGNKTQNQRERALAAFERWDVDTLVATDVAARGIDVADITHVVNFDAPEDQDGYVHRTGRTGRAGRDGLAITFVLGDQARDIGAIAHKLGLETDFERAGFAPHVSPRPQHQPSRNGGGSGRGGRNGGRGGRSRDNRR
jgi:ATP-dependent RNA helicase RhlE